MNGHSFLTAECFARWLVLGAVVCCGALELTESAYGAQPAGVVVDLFPGATMRPKVSPWRVTIANLDQTPPTVSTRDASKDVPGLTGMLGGGTGSISVTLDGRSDDASQWIATTWSGGASHPVSGSEAGLGLSDSAGGNKVDGGEAIVWAFDLSALKLASGESLILTRVDFGGEAEGEKAEFWRRVDGKGTRIATGGRWEGNIAVAHGDEFALAGNGRLRSLTLRIGSKAASPAAAATATSAASVRVSGSAPNIIMILADDMAWYDTPVRMDERLENSAQEIMRSLKDPANPTQPYKWNLQKLADQGMLFRNAYSAAPQCTPTRASMQTGMTTARHRLSVELGGKGIGEFNLKPELQTFPVIPSGVRKPFPPDMVTIPEALAPFGYQCAHYGKWHLESDPLSEGYAETDGDTDNGAGKTYDAKDPLIPADLENAKRIKEITDKAIAFATKQKSGGRPFYIQMSHYAVHAPWECKQSSRALFQNHPDVVAFNKGQTDPAKLNRKNDPAVFFGMMFELDQSVGRIVQAIDELGLTKKTYVIFKSDNGYRRFDTQHFMQPFYGEKWFLWQGGIRVPLIVKGPGVPAGSVSTANVVTYDLLPTFHDWASGAAGRLSNVDGLSLKGILRGEPPKQSFLDRPLYFHYPHYRSSMPLSAVVKGDYKLVYSWDATIRTDISVADPRMLFNLAVDPGEFHNLTAKNPALAASLWKELDSYLTSVEARRPRDNSAVYRADGGKEFEADDNAKNRDLFPPFEASRKPNLELNDLPRK